MIEDALSVAHSTYLDWRQLPISRRGEYVHRLGELLLANKEMLAQQITQSMGKLAKEARREVERCAKSCESMPALADQYLASEKIPTDHANSYICYQPLGVILGITPWNFPLWQVIRFALPNLLAGNTVLVKAAPNVTGCVEALQKLLLQAGFPAGVFQQLPISEAEVEQVIRDKRVQGVALTGSVRAGRAIARIAGEALKKTVLELGGSDAFIVLEDADLELAVDAACAARYMNAGQICVAAKRLMVQDAIADEFIRRYVDRVSRYRFGNPAEEDSNLSHLARSDLCDYLDQQVKASVQMGARILIGGERDPLHQSAYKATVLDRVTAQMPVFREEVFGPVSALVRFTTDAEAIALANDSEFGLGATVWTRNRQRGEQLALQIDSGMVYVNSLLRSDIRLPFGGIKHSGFGRELGAAGFREFTNIKTIVVN